ncbi:MAG: UDPGP type 1 family protein [Gemmataceae bacterium]|nr:UDPGP type 1 family protein [Gemmataceae bacterium]
MLAIPAALRQRLQQFGQEHVIDGWDRLADEQRQGLLAQLNAIDLEQMQRLYAQRDKVFAVPSPEKIAPVPVLQLNADVTEEKRLGTEALARGEVAVLLVAGGQGSRLGFDHPKGMYGVGPVSNKSLFQIHAEKVLALRRRHKHPVPFLVMTSDATDQETKDFFAAHRWFGLPDDEVTFFRQGTMPALDLQSGRLLLDAPGKLFTSPNGHGGTLTALADDGILDRLSSQGIKEIFYFQVDNPLVKVADPVFLGHHLKAHAEVSSKIVAKLGPTDKLGNLALVDGRCTIIEYSDLPEALAKQTDEHGKLRLWAGSPAIHVFSLEFLRRVTQGALRIPFHVARKKVPCLDATGKLVQPQVENALKFEMFIFDVLPMAERWTVVETSRREEFEPLKNATGADSPATVKAAISNLAADWLAKAGVTVPRDANGSAAVPLEISPLYALDAEELAGKVDCNLKIDGPTYLFKP